MGKRGRRLKLRLDETRNEQCGGGPEREGVTHRPYDPNYNRVPYDQDTWGGKMARTYNPETIDHYDATRRALSKGDGHLPQPVRIETTPSQQAIRDLFLGAERIFAPLSPEPTPIPPQVEPSDDSNSPVCVPPYKKGGWKIVEL